MKGLSEIIEYKMIDIALPLRDWIIIFQMPPYFCLFVVGSILRQAGCSILSQAVSRLGLPFSCQEGLLCQKDKIRRRKEREI